MKTTFCITLLAASALSFPVQARIQQFLGTGAGNNVGVRLDFKRFLLSFPE